VATTTTEQRRRRAKVEFDAYLATCPARQVLETLANKWVGLVLCALADGPKRHGDLARIIPGVSQKMLTQTLRLLERDGLVSRTVTAQIPIRVDYALTPLGDTFVPLVFGIKTWSQDHIQDIERARARYDRANGQPQVSRSPAPDPRRPPQPATTGGS
jgi:DNA-binding HxlR family transcriptional regulator